MTSLQDIKKSMSQIIAITEKNLKINVRFKAFFIFSSISPIITIVMPLILMQRLFKLDENFAPWNGPSYYVFIFLAYNISLLSNLVIRFPKNFKLEKFWKTLPIIIIGPSKRFYLSFGVFFSHLIGISIPFTCFFILSFIAYPISMVTVFFVLGAFLLIALIFSGIGLMFGVFAISNENILGLLLFIYPFLIWFSCLMYPFAVFPEFIQVIINLNPLYYMFDVIRMMWIENNIITTFTLHPLPCLLFIVSAVILPLLGVLIFNKVYSKLGIVGY